jgi:lipoic acid synthetase
MKVDRYVEPAEFDRWKQVAEDLGFLYVASGPLVRSSYKVSSDQLIEVIISNSRSQAGEFYIENVLRGKSAERRLKRLPTDQLESSTASLPTSKVA